MGQYALGACIPNFNTGLDDVLALLEIVVRAGRKADEEPRAAGPP